MNNIQDAYHYHSQKSQELQHLHPNIESIILAKRQIINNLLQQNKSLLFDMEQRKTDIVVIQAKILEAQQKQFRKKQLQDKERSLQTEYDDLQRMSAKLAKDTKMLNDQEQIKRGKAIIQYNKIKEVKEEQETQKRKKNILERQLEQIQKNSEALRKKLKTVKEEKRKKVMHKEKVDQTYLQNQIKKLSIELAQSNNHIAKIHAERQKYLPLQQLHQVEKQLEQAKKQAAKYHQLRNFNNKLNQDRESLEERIKLFKYADSDFVCEKKMRIQELKQKQILIESRRRQCQSVLQQNQQKLKTLTTQYPQLLQQKKAKKKRKGKSKNQKEENQKLQRQDCKQDVIQELQPKSHRWKISNKIRHIFWKISVILLVLGLFLSSLNGLFFS